MEPDGRCGVLAGTGGIVEAGLEIRERRLATGAPGHNLLAFIDETGVVEGLEAPEHRLHVVRIHGLVVVLEVDPTTEAIDDLFPLPGVGENRPTTLLVEALDAVFKDEWIVLLDSDILLPPDYLKRIDAVTDTETFIAPDGRRLLTPETTAKILLGDLSPWEDWDSLMNDSGEFRHRETRGIPVGFCQCFKAHYLREHPYLEVEHFEIADMDFGIKVLKDSGPEYRLSGAPVLHLDHNGSQWYGTRKQM